MSTTVTVSLRSIVVPAVVTTALVVALAGVYTVGAARAGAADPQPSATVVQSSTTQAQDGIFVRGTGEAAGVPDRLRFSLSTHATASGVSAAVAEASAAARRVLAALREHGVARRDVQTTGLSLRPVYDYGDDGPPQITGYAASERFSVLVRDIPRAGEALSAAVESGGNAVRLGDMRLEIGDEQALLRQARAEAFAAARAKAQQYAAASGRRLGEVVSVREGVAGPPPRESITASFDLLAKRGAIPIRRGSEEVTVSVSLVWAFA
jgi:uncharacterized protein